MSRQGRYLLQLLYSCSYSVEHGLCSSYSMTAILSAADLDVEHGFCSSYSVTAILLDQRRHRCGTWFLQQLQYGSYSIRSAMSQMWNRVSESNPAYRERKDCYLDLYRSNCMVSKSILHAMISSLKCHSVLKLYFTLRANQSCSTSVYNIHSFASTPRQTRLARAAIYLDNELRPRAQQ